MRHDDFDYLSSIYKLKNIVRYNTRFHIKDETVAEHSFFVAMIALRLCDKYDISKDDTRKVLIKALLHDMPEIELNDITHDVKTKLNLAPMLKTYEDDYYERNFKEYAELMKDDSINIVNLIVWLADAESVLQYVKNEKSLGNTTNEISLIKDDTYNRIDVLEHQIEDYLKGDKHE